MYYISFNSIDNNSLHLVNLTENNRKTRFTSIGIMNSKSLVFCSTKLFLKKVKISGFHFPEKVGNHM